MKNYFNTKKGEALLKEYLQKFKGGSLRVYSSEISQYFSFAGCDLSGITKESLHAYQAKLAKEHSPKTAKRKFSILNGFSKFLEGKEKLGFKNPFTDGLKPFRTHTGAESEDLQKYLEKFLDTLHTRNTQRSYANMINLCFEHVGKDLMEIGKADIEAYRDFLLKEGYKKKNGEQVKYKDSALWSKFIALKKFFLFVQGENRKFKSPMTSLKALNIYPPPRDKGHYDILNEAESKRLLKAPDIRTKIGIRDRLIICFFLIWGLRANEICKIRHGDQDGDRVGGQLRIWIKSRKGKFRNRPTTPIVLNGKALQAWDAWMDVLKKARIKTREDLPVFLPFTYDRGDRGLTIKRCKEPKPLSVGAIENLVAKYLVKARIERDGKALSPHALRHTALTSLARAGVDIQDLKQIAGHSNVETTMLYVRAREDFKNNVGKSSPFNK